MRELLTRSVSMDQETISPAIEAHGLRKKFGQKVAVKDLSFRVRRGEIFGFLGPNGAGKTTAIKMLVGLTRPTAGSARILGGSINETKITKNVVFFS